MLEAYRRQLGEVMADLNAASDHKVGTPWWLDRVNEAAWLSRQIGRLESKSDAAYEAAYEAEIDRALAAHDEYLSSTGIGC